MIKINIVAVGKVKEDYFKAGIEEYLKRLSKYAAVNIIEVKEETFNQGETQLERQKILAAEEAYILPRLKGDVVALCIEGAAFDSQKFASYIKQSIDSGKELTFVIGGSYGLNDKIKSMAAKKLSLSDMTFPHTLTRLILTEQLYRAFSIINKTPYHK